MLSQNSVCKTIVALLTLITLAIPQAAAADVSCLSDEANAELTKLEKWYNSQHSNKTLDLDKPDSELCARDTATRNFLAQKLNESMTEFKNNFYNNKVPALKTDLKNYIDNKTQRMDEFAKALNRFNKLYNQSINLDKKIESKASQKKVSQLNEQVTTLEQKLDKRYMNEQELEGRFSDLNASLNAEIQETRQKFLSQQSSNSGVLFGLSNRVLAFLFVAIGGGLWFLWNNTNVLDSIKEKGRKTGGIGTQIGNQIEEQLTNNADEGSENSQDSGDENESG